MNVENTQNFQEDRNKYKDFRDMLADGSLSPKEVEDLHMRYEGEKEDIKTNTLELSADLQREVEQYKQMAQMSRAEIRLLQKLTSTPKWEVDGQRGPSSFARYRAFVETYPQFQNIWPQELTIKLSQDIKTTFHSLSRAQKIQVQKQVKAHADGFFGKNTLGKIMENISQDSKLQSLFFKSRGDTQKEVSPWEEREKIVKQKQIISTIQETKLEGRNTDTHNAWEQEISLEKNPEEIKTALKLQAKQYGGGLIRKLQAKLKNITADGIFGNQSADRILEKYPELTQLKDVFKAEGIDTEVDGVLSSSNDIRVLKENFTHLYGEYITKLWDNLDLPQWFIEAIIKKETTYGKALNSETGSKWLMQLTKWPFKDMRWDVGDHIWVDSKKVLRYQELFKKIDFDDLMTTKIWDEKTASSKIPMNIKKHFNTLQSSTDVPEIQKSITALFTHIKWNKYEYDHETNIIIGSVYLAWLYESTWENIWKTAKSYNGDKKIARNGKETRVNYANTVQKYFKVLKH